MGVDQDPTFRTPAGTAVPAVTADGMREVDRVAVEEVGVSLLMMMEHAGRSLADPLRGYDGRVLVLAGGGGNGGGGLCAARHLLNAGVDVDVVLGPDPAELTGAAATQFGVLQEMGVSPAPDESVEGADLILDALVGYGLAGPLRGRTADLVERVGATDAEVRSLDVPSGVNATTGDRPGPSVDADLTTTLALPKTGLADVGPVRLADIGLPRVVFARAGIDYEWPYGDGVAVELAVDGSG
jgi:NAD(P)H-hydrate epimerase